MIGVSRGKLQRAAAPIATGLLLAALTTVVWLRDGPQTKVAASCERPSAASVVVKSGDTLNALSRTYYGTELCSGAIARQNEIQDISDVHSGDVLQLPTNAIVTASQGATYSAAQIRTAPDTHGVNAAISTFGTSRSGFIWPVLGPITQPFGVPELGVGAPHTGIDIGQDQGSPVLAAASGRVTFAGGEPCCGLGYWVEINHGNRYATRYGHLMRPPLVLSGDYVNQGQVIGFSGNTGFSTGPHVHFELRLDGTPIDPLRALPIP